MNLRPQLAHPLPSLALPRRSAPDRAQYTQILWEMVDGSLRLDYLPDPATALSRLAREAGLASEPAHLAPASAVVLLGLGGEGGDLLWVIAEWSREAGLSVHPDVPENLVSSLGALGW